MSDECAGGMPTPSAEHADLLKAAGIWHVKGRFFMAPDAPPMETTGVETVGSVGGFWVVGRYESEFFGAPFHGRGTAGYDAWKKVYVSTWVDSMSPSMISLTGTKVGNVLTMEGDGVDPSSGAPCRYKTVESIEENTRVFTMYLVMPDGSDLRIMELTYTRR